MCQGEKCQKLGWTDEQGPDYIVNACLIKIKNITITKFYIGDHGIPRRVLSKNNMRMVRERRVTNE